MPDPNLRQAVREKLNLSQNTPLTVLHLERLYDLVVSESDITNLQGLEHAVDLRFLHLSRSQIADITPLAGLVSLEVLKLYANDIVDITPLADLINLRELALNHNRIVDITALAGLVNLRILELHNNRIADFSPLADLMNLETLSLRTNTSIDLSMINTSKVSYLEVDMVCDIQRPSAQEHIQGRDYPSLVSSWGAGVVLDPDQEDLVYIATHDLHFCCPDDLNIYWRNTAEGLKLVGDFEDAKRRRDHLLSLNPNLVLLVPVRYYSGIRQDYKEVGWDYIPDDIFLRDANGNVIIDEWNEKLLDFTLPQTQRFVRDQVLALSQCGLFDGIFLDHWDEDRRLRGYRTLEEEYAARDAILQGIREIDEDFLILVNANQQKISRWARYVNGIWMETQPGEDGIYDTAEIAEIQETLLWAEAAVQEPRINGLHGFGSIWEPPDSPQNWRSVRFFTTMGLTLSDGYVMFELNSYYDVILNKLTPSYEGVYPIWYEFWSADLGQSIGAKAQLYENREGLFVREFTNGWAVYNRSGKEQSIQLPGKVKAVASGLTGTAHTIPDLDGEIYLKQETKPSADVNGDGVVNIQDLVIVANALGEVEPDLNGDSVVNIQDLVIVANAFGQ